MLSIYRGRNDYPVKCQLYSPIYVGEGATKKAIDWQPSDKFCWCRETNFQTTQHLEGSRRIKTTNGTLETISLKKDEIDLDWKIEFEGILYVILEMTQEDDTKQQVLLKNAVVKTTLKVRG